MHDFYQVMLMSWRLRATALLGFVLFLSAFAAVPGPPPIPLGLGPALDQIVPVILLFAVAFIVWKYVPRRKSGKTNGTSHDLDQHESTVRQRYAQGDITREQYLQMLDDLRRKI